MERHFGIVKMTSALLLSGALTASSGMECNLGPPPGLRLVSPLRSQEIISGTTIDVVIDVPAVGIHGPSLELVPAYDEDQSSDDDSQGSRPLRLVPIARAGMAVGKNRDGWTRISAKILVDTNRSQVAHAYVLVVSFRFGEGQCENTYDDSAGIFNVLPSPT